MVINNKIMEVVGIVTSSEINLGLFTANKIDFLFGKNIYCSVTTKRQINEFLVVKFYLSERQQHLKFCSCERMNVTFRNTNLLVIFLFFFFFFLWKKKIMSV